MKDKEFSWIVAKNKEHQSCTYYTMQKKSRQMSWVKTTNLDDDLLQTTFFGHEYLNRMTSEPKLNQEFHFRLFVWTYFLIEFGFKSFVGAFWTDSTEKDWISRPFVLFGPNCSLITIIVTNHYYNHHPH